MIFEELKVSAPPPLAESLHKYFRTSEMIIIFSMPDKTVFVEWTNHIHS